jgi:hypothetical protein
MWVFLKSWLAPFNGVNADFPAVTGLNLKTFFDRINRIDRILRPIFSFQTKLKMFPPLRGNTTHSCEALTRFSTPQHLHYSCCFLPQATSVCSRPSGARTQVFIRSILWILSKNAPAVDFLTADF